jgi:hypothetical protein
MFVFELLFIRVEAAFCSCCACLLTMLFLNGLIALARVGLAYFSTCRCLLVYADSNAAWILYSLQAPNNKVAEEYNNFQGCETEAAQSRCQRIKVEENDC